MNAQVNIDFPARLRSLREARGLNLEELNVAAGLARSTVNRYELGYGRPSWPNVCALARVLGVAPAELYWIPLVKRQTHRGTATDPNEADYTDTEREALRAVDRYKTANHRPHPALTEILAVLQEIGWTPPPEG